MDRSGSLDDALDTALDAVVEGRPAPAGPPELAPLVEAAAALCAELAGAELDPAVAQRHLDRVLGVPTLHAALSAAPAARAPTKPPFGTVIPEPPARRRGGWRRRVVAGLLAAALLLAPTLLASAGALPGDLLYPVKLGVEAARVGVDRASPADLARLRIGIAGTRLHELKLLFDRQQISRLAAAVVRADRAVSAAEHAVARAARSVDRHQLVALERRLRQVQGRQAKELSDLKAYVDRLPTTSVSAQVKSATQEAISRAQQQPHNPAGPPATVAPGGPAGSGQPAPGSTLPPGSTAVAPATSGLLATTTTDQADDGERRKHKSKPNPDPSTTTEPAPSTEG